MFIAVTVSVAGWLMFLVALVAAVRLRGDVQDLERALAEVKRQRQCLEQETRDWATRNGRHAHRASVLFQGLADVVDRARKALEEQENVK